jgi:uncharacterized protein
MTISMYGASVPVFTRMLRNLAGIVEKGAAHAEARKIEPAVLINMRLYPDMLPFSKQIQIATDMAKGCAARLAGQEPVKFEDNEATFPELLARVEKTIAYLNTFSAQQIDGTEEKTITLPMRTGPLTFTGMAYLLNFAYPNFYFHVTTAHDILRHCGVEVGKWDFLGKQ